MDIKHRVEVLFASCHTLRILGVSFSFGHLILHLYYTREQIKIKLMIAKPNTAFNGGDSRDLGE